MRVKPLLLVAAMSTCALSSGVIALADEKHESEKHESRVTLESIPAAARQAILKEAHGAPVLNVELEKKNGKTLYEAHVKKGGDLIGILVDADGKLIGKHSEKEEHEEHEHEEHEHHGK